MKPPYRARLDGKKEDDAANDAQAELRPEGEHGQVAQAGRSAWGDVRLARRRQVADRRRRRLLHGKKGGSVWFGHAQRSAATGVVRNRSPGRRAPITVRIASSVCRGHVPVAGGKFIHLVEPVGAVAGARWRLVILCAVKPGPHHL